MNIGVMIKLIIVKLFYYAFILIKKFEIVVYYLFNKVRFVFEKKKKKIEENLLFVIRLKNIED